MTEIEQLRKIAQDPSMPMDSRQEAATLLVRLQEEAIRSEGVADDDDEVAVLLKPWPRDLPWQAGLADIAAPHTQGRSLTGWSLPDARAEVLARRILRLRLAVVVDEGLPMVLRESVVDTIRRDTSQPYYSRATMDTIKKPSDTK